MRDKICIYTPVIAVDRSESRRRNVLSIISSSQQRCHIVKKRMNEKVAVRPKKFEPKLVKLENEFNFQNTIKTEVGQKIPQPRSCT